jgi:hypothetical protein
MQRVAVQPCKELGRAYKQSASEAQADWLVSDNSYDFVPIPCIWFLDVVAHVSTIAYPFVTQYSRQLLGPLPALS